MRTILNISVVAVLFVVAPSLCFAEMGIEQVTKERGKELGMELRLKKAGSDSVTMELAFTTVGELKSFGGVEMQVRDGAKVLVSASLREERPSSGRVVVSFSAVRAILDKLTLRVVVSERMLGGTGYDLRVVDFVDMTKFR